jgi:hypothetical protein
MIFLRLLHLLGIINQMIFMKLKESRLLVAELIPIVTRMATNWVQSGFGLWIKNYLD